MNQENERSHAFRAVAFLFLAWLSVSPGGRAAAEEPFDLLDHVTLSASNRVRGEFVSWFDPEGPNSNESYGFFANRVRFGVTLGFPSVEFFVEGQDTRLVNLPGSDSINAAVGTLGPGAVYFANTHDRDQGETILHRGFATVRRFGLPGVAVSVGRLGYNHGLEKVSADRTVAWLQKSRISQRLIGNFDYTHVGRSFDGVQVLYDYGVLNWTTLVARPTAGGFEISANRQISDIGLISSTASLVGDGNLGPYALQAFYIYYDDGRNLAPADNRPLAPPSGSCAGVSMPGLFRSCDHGNIAISTVGADLIQTTKLGPGTAEALVWGGGQFGDWQSLDHQGWAYAVETGYRLDDVALSPWLRAGFFRSSGDDDPSDDRHRTFFQILPTARIYAETPFYNMMNNQDLFVQALLEPEKGATLALGGHWLRVTESADLVYSGGGANSDKSFGYSGYRARGANELAYLVDASLTYAMTKHVQVYGYYGHAFGQGVISRNFAGTGTDYGYIEATVSY
jgi:hypothetical protein